MSDFQIPFFSTLVGLLADVMRVCLEFCYKLTDDLGIPSYGIAIIVLTIIIKTLLLPLAVKQIKSMKAMQEIQPEMQKIQKKYRNDPKKLREEMSKLYKDNGANPMSGCLPLLIQMPFLVSIYYALQGFPYDPAHESFLWLESLAVPDSTYILPILSAASTFIISWQTMPKDAPGNQKTMLVVMPLMIGWMSLNFPSGLVIYWIVVNLYQLVQQTIMFRGEMKERFMGGSKGKTLTVHGENQPAKKAKKADKAEAAEEAPKHKKVIRKRVIKKVVRKKADVDHKEEAPKQEDAKKNSSKEETPVKESHETENKNVSAEKAAPVKEEKPAEDSAHTKTGTGEADETK